MVMGTRMPSFRQAACMERRESGDAGEFAKLEAMSADELRSFLTAALEGDEVIEADGDGGSVH